MSRYLRKDLLYNHYLFSTDTTGQSGGGDLVTDTLELMEGYDILLFSNTFLDLFMPGHEVIDLHSLEFVLLHHLPPTLTTKKDIALWLSKNLYFVEYVKHNHLCYSIK